MVIDLDKRDLISLVKGKEPSYAQMDHPLCKSQGTYSASYDRWSWNRSAFSNQTEQELWDFYCYLKTPVIKPSIGMEYYSDGLENVNGYVD